MCTVHLIFNFAWDSSTIKCSNISLVESRIERRARPPNEILKFDEDHVGRDWSCWLNQILFVACNYYRHVIDAFLWISRTLFLNVISITFPNRPFKPRSCTKLENHSSPSHGCYKYVHLTYPAYALKLKLKKKNKQTKTYYILMFDRSNLSILLKTKINK